VCWSNDSTELLSGSYDHTVKSWDVTKGKLLTSYPVQGFVQGLQYNPSGNVIIQWQRLIRIDNNIFTVGSTSKQVLTYDKRQPTSVSTLDNDSMINTMCVS
jgi:WD40 repeat protein